MEPPQARYREHDVELGAYEREIWWGCGFGKNVGEVVFAGDEADNQGFGGDFVTNEVKVNFDVFGVSMKGRICR